MSALPFMVALLPQFPVLRRRYMQSMFRVLNHMFVRYARQKSDPFLAQERALMRILKHAQGSRFASDYGLDRVGTMVDYVDAKPVLHFEDLKPYWERAERGEHQVFTDETVTHFAMTAGTTGARKLVPVTESFTKNSRRQLVHALSIYLIRHPESGLLFKAGLGITGRSRVTKTAAGIPCGLISGIGIEITYPVLRARGVPSMATLNIEDWDEKLTRMAQESDGKTIGFIAGIPSSIVSFLERTTTVLSPERYRCFASNLELIVSSGLSHLPYRSKIETSLVKDPEYINLYMASEGVLGHEPVDDPTCLELFAGETLFKFILHVDYLAGDYSRRVGVDRLEAGAPYTLLITTGSGAFSYVVGDVLRCTSVGAAPRFQIAGRTVLTLDVVAEKTSVEAVEKTLLDVSEELGASSVEFFVTVDTSGEKPNYVWVIEDDSTWSDTPLESIAARLDERLCVHSKNYEYFSRIQPQIGSCRVALVEPRKFQLWLQARTGEQGHRKVPRILRDPAEARDLI